jgi:acyl-homoserine lactone acylase PvdQ
MSIFHEGDHTGGRPGRSGSGRLGSVLLALVALAITSGPRAGAAEAILHRDTWGVPHACGDTEAAGLYALGYAQAEDRLADIYLAIRTAIGRLAEVQGPGAVEQDYIMRLARNDRLHAEYLEKAAPARLRGNVTAFAAGIRRYVADHPDEAADLKIEVEPWHPLAIGRAMILRWPIGTMMDDLKNAEPRAKPAAGSNQWAVAPSRSADGSAILLSDPHLTWEGLAVLYEARVHAGDLHMAGFWLIGSPMLAIGHNRHAGWALTTGGPDTSDVYRMKFRIAPRPEYEYDGQWRPVTIEQVTIPVRGGEPVTRPVFSTHLGPVIAPPDMATGTAYVGASPYLDQTGLYEQFDRMARARNVHEVNAALALHQYNEQNVMSADVEGNIAYVRNGATPIRPEGYDFTRPVDGTTSATAWKGIHPQEDLVRLLNPRQGYMQNCNIAPHNMMVDCELTPDRFPGHVYNATWDQNNPRGRRSIEVLHNDPLVTRDEAISYALDVHDRLARAWQAELGRAYGAAGDEVAADSELRRAVEAVLAWDGEYTPEATATVLFKFWRLKCGARCDVAPLVRDGRLDDATRAKIIGLFRETIDELKRDHGRWDVPWGTVHVVGRTGRYFPCGGADYSTGDKEANFSETLFDVRSVQDPEDPKRYVANSGSMAVILMFFKDGKVESFTCTPWGQSAHPDSPHHADQAEKLYSPRRMKPTWWDEADLAHHLESTRRFTLPDPAAAGR